MAALCGRVSASAVVEVQIRAEVDGARERWPNCVAALLVGPDGSQGAQVTERVRTAPGPYLICWVAVLLPCHASRDGFQGQRWAVEGRWLLCRSRASAATESAAVELDQVARGREGAF